MGDKFESPITFLCFHKAFGRPLRVKEKCNDQINFSVVKMGRNVNFCIGTLQMIMLSSFYSTNFSHIVRQLSQIVVYVKNFFCSKRKEGHKGP